MKKTSKRILSALTACLCVSLNLTIISLAQPISNEKIATNEKITISEEYFPDEKFLSYIKTSNFDINQDDKLSPEDNLESREVALFANGVKVTESQMAVNGQELTFVYDTTKGMINPTGEVVLTLVYIEKDNTKKDISNLTIVLDRKDVKSEDIKVPEINEDVNLDELEIKDGDTVLKLGVDYDIGTTENL